MLLQPMQVQVCLLYTLYISYLVCVRNLYRKLSHTHTPPSFCYAFATHAAHAAHTARAGTAGTAAGDCCDTETASWYVYACVDIDIYEFESKYICACIGYIHHVGLYVCVCICRCIR